MLEVFNCFRSSKEYDYVDLSLTPWKLCLVSPLHPFYIFIYFATHEEAKDHEDICLNKGWTSNGVVWYDL